MRRNLAALAVLGTLFLAAGCSDETASTETAGAPTPATEASGGTAPTTPVDPTVAASADAALSGNTKAICAQATRTSATFGETFLADLRLQLDTTAKGAPTKGQAEQKIERDVQNYSYALADMAKLSTDPALKKALTQMSKQVTALKGDVTKINAEKMSALTATLDKACGKG
ncbi:hypothetical protein ACWKSP_23470 [Micromonosporaceae bacterium Da 78-11]